MYVIAMVHGTDTSTRVMAYLIQGMVRGTCNTLGGDGSLSAARRFGQKRYGQAYLRKWLERTSGRRLYYTLLPIPEY